MIIYDALLSEKRIIFYISNNEPVHQLSTYIFGCLHMVSPPLFGILNRVYPYVTLNNTDCMKRPGYIAGVNNPMFKQHEDWWDVFCDIEEHKVYTNAHSQYNYKEEPYSTLDNELLNSLIEKMDEKCLKEEELCASFEEYTQVILDIAMGLNSIYEDQYYKTMSDFYANRVAALKKTQGYQYYVKITQLKDSKKINFSSLLNIDRGIRKLKYKAKLPEKDIINIYSSIDTYIKGEVEILEV
jgi:hypothetical protein